MATLIVSIEVKGQEVIKFLNDPFNLRLWTVHRDLYCIGDGCNEAIFRDGKIQFAEIQSSIEAVKRGIYMVNFSWFKDNIKTKSFGFQIIETADSRVNLKLEIPNTLPVEKQNKMIPVINIELGLLKQLLEKSTYIISEADAVLLQAYHENLSFT